MEDKILPIARDELGNIYVESRYESIYYINYHGGNKFAQRVADNFRDFVSKITSDDD
jgi:hypothetical protein